MTSSDSLRRMKDLVKHVRKLSLNNAPIAIVANKSDLEHLRQISRKHGMEVAKRLRCALFCELSVSNEVRSSRNIFIELYKRVERRQRKHKQLLEMTTRRMRTMVFLSKIFSHVAKSKGIGFSKKKYVGNTSEALKQNFIEDGRKVNYLMLPSRKS